MKCFIFCVGLVFVTSQAFAQTTPLFNGTGPRYALTKLGPQANVVIPANFIKINVGESWQAKINANPSALGFRIATGVHKNQTITPKANQQFWGESGAIVDGTKSTRFLTQGSASGIKFCNLVIKDYRAEFQKGVIGQHASLMIENCEIYGTTEGFGTFLGRHILRSRLHNNAQGSWFSSRTDGAIMEDCEIWGDNVPRRYGKGGTVTSPAGLDYADWTSKFYKCTRPTVRYCYFHDLNTIAIYSDINVFDSQFYNNRILNCKAHGINLTKSYRGTLRNNWISGCQPADNSNFRNPLGIIVYTTREVVVKDNIVENCWGAIHLWSDNVSGDYASGRWSTTGCRVENNQMTNCPVLVNLRRGSDPTDIVGAAGNNKYTGNKYKKGSAAGYLQLNNSNRTFTQWKAAGYDTTGSFVP